MATLDLFGRKWNLRIVWELHHDPLGFRALQQRCDNMSSSVLRQRLTELTDARIVEQRSDTTYQLTVLGHGAYRALRPLVRWSDEWAATLACDHSATDDHRPQPDVQPGTPHTAQVNIPEGPSAQPLGGSAARSD